MTGELPMHGDPPEGQIQISVVIIDTGQQLASTGATGGMDAALLASVLMIAGLVLVLRSRLAGSRSGRWSNPLNRLRHGGVPRRSRATPPSGG